MSDKNQSSTDAAPASGDHEHTTSERKSLLDEVKSSPTATKELETSLKVDKSQVEESQAVASNSPRKPDEAVAENEIKPDENSEQELIKIELDFSERLLKTKVLQPEQIVATNELARKVTIDARTSGLYNNGIVFSKYLLTLKRIVKRQENQDLNIDHKKIKGLAVESNPQTRLANWNAIGYELDKIGISLEPEVKSQMVAGDQPQIDRLFLRIERYMKIIAGAQFLKFENLEDELCESARDSEYQEIDISDNQSVAQSVNQSVGKSLISLNQSSMKSKSKASLIKTQEKSPTASQKSPAAGSKSPAQSSKSLLPPMFSRRKSSSQHESALKIEENPTEEKSKERTIPTPPKSEQIEIMEQPQYSRRGRPVKDGVDIINMDVNRPVTECDSSLELILATLAKAFSMKAKQAAALLTNNNQYLVHACVKGVKGGRYQPVLVWYGDLVENGEVLADLLECEMQQLPQTSKQTFLKVLAALGCGFYSHNYEVVELTFQLFMALYRRFSKSLQMVELALKWFLSTQSSSGSDGEDLASPLTPATPTVINAQQNGGLKLSLHALKRHFEAAPLVMETINIFCTVKEQLYIILKDELANHTASTSEYIRLLNDLLPFINIKEHQENGLIDHWVELCSREAENDGKHLVEERIAALSVLAELWLQFTDFVDSKQEMASTILFMLKRAVRERSKSIRMAATVYLFKLLDKFSETKNPAAPTMYKTLIFALIESPNDPTIRELYFTNFTNLFEINPNIPIGLLIDPLLKQIQMSIGVAYILKVFDFDFFVFLTRHPKCSPAIAAQIFDLLAKLSLNDLGYSLAAQEPIAILIQRYNDQEVVVPVVENFIVACMDALLSLEPMKREDAMSKLALKQKREERTRNRLHAGRDSHVLPITSKITVTTNIGPSSTKRATTGVGKPPNPKSFTGPKQEQEILRRLKKSLTVTLMIKIQTLNDSNLNENVLKPQLLETQRRFVELYGYFNKGVVELLRYYGDPDQLYQTYTESGAAHEYATQSQPIHSQIGSPIRAVLSQDSSKKTLDGMSNQRHSRQGIHNYQSADKNGTLAVVPYQDDQPKKKDSAYSKSQTRQKALQHIQQIKANRKEKEESKQKQVEKSRALSARRKLRLQKEIEKRKIELGVPARVTAIDGHAKPLALIYREGGDAPQETYHTLSKKSKKQQVQVVNIEEEEDADKEAVQELMKKYSRLWKNLFSKYQHQGFKQKSLNQDFDALQNRPSKLMLPEVTKLLKEHGFFPTYVSKDEIQTLIRLLNQKNHKELQSGSDLQALNYSNFLKFIEQLGFNCLNRPPKDLSHRPAVESLKFLISVFENTTKEKGLSVMLYEVEGKETSGGDEENEEIKEMNKKVNEDPEFILPEGFVKVNERKPVYSYDLPDSMTEVLGEAKTVSLQVLDDFFAEILDFHFLEGRVTWDEKVSVKEAVPKITAPKRAAPALTYMKPVQRAKLEPIKPKYEPDEKTRARNAEAKKEYLRKVEERKAQKEQEKLQEEEREAQEKEEKYQKSFEQRKKTLHQIQQTKERLEKEKAKKEEEEQEKRAKKEQEDEENKAETVAKKAEQREFIKKQNTKLQGNFRQMSKERQSLSQKRDLIEQQDQEYKKKLKQSVEKSIKEGTKQREQTKNQMQEYSKFLEKPDVAQVITDHEKGLNKYFSFYCLQGKAELGMDTDFKTSNLHFKEFVKFGYQSKITPVVASSEEVVSTFRFIARNQEAERLEKEGDEKGEATRANDKLNSQQYISYESFKKALVRIAIVGQESLGGQTEEQKKRNEDLEKQRKETQQKKKEKFSKKAEERQQVEKEVMQDMRQEFDKKKAKIEEALSRSPTQGGLSNSQSEKSLKKLELKNSAARSAHEEEFNRWLKQQEAVGMGHQQRVQEKLFKQPQPSSEVLETESNLSDANPSTGGAQLFRIRSNYQSQIQKLEKQASIKSQQLKSGDLRDHRRVTKEYDINSISARTMQALFKFMGIEAGEQSAYLLEEKLNAQRIEVSGQKPTMKIKRQLIPERLGTIKEGGETARKDEKAVEKSATKNVEHSDQESPEEKQVAELKQKLQDAEEEVDLQ